jgi:hypothetical protein
MINAGDTIRADDFINESEKDETPANDEGRVPKLEDDAKLSETWFNPFSRTLLGQTENRFYQLSDNVQHANDSVGSMSGGTYVKIKQTTINEDLDIARITYRIYTGSWSGASDYSDFQLRINGSAVQTSSHASSVPSTKTFNTSSGLNAGDTVEVWAREEGAIPSMKCDRLRICFEGAITGFGGRTLVTPLVITDGTVDATSDL